MINRRLKPHRRPCAHFWSGSKPYGSPPGREEFVAPAVDKGHKRDDSITSSTRIGFSVHTGAYFERKGREVLLKPTPEAIRMFNRSRTKRIGLFHVTC